MIGFLSAKVWGYLFAAIVAASLGGVLWYAGGSQCRVGLAEASLRHQEEMTELRDKLSLEHAKNTANLVRDRHDLQAAVDKLVADLSLCSYSHDSLQYFNTLRSN